MNELGPNGRIIAAVGIYAMAALVYVLLRPLVRKLFRQNEWFGWVILAILASALIQSGMREALTART